MIKIIHIGDLHLGGTYPEKAAASIDHLIGDIGDPFSPAHAPDMVVCTGDTTEREIHVHSDHLQPLIKLIGAVECPFLFLQGTPTHEKFGFLTNLQDATRQLITVYDEPRVDNGAIDDWSRKGFLAADSRIAIASLPALTRWKLNEWVTKLLGAPLDTPEENVEYLLGWISDQWKDFKGPKILLGHWTIGGCITSTGQTLYGSDISIPLDWLGKTGANAVLTGHIHKAQDWRVGDTLVSYCGSSHPCNWGELDEKSFTVLEFDEQTGAVTNFTRVPYQHKPMIKVDLVFSGEQMPDGSWACDLDLEDIAGNLATAEVKVCYSVSKEIAPHVDDMHVRVLFHRIGVELAAVERTIRASDRDRIENIGEKQTTRDQYLAVCMAKGEIARGGALAKADVIDEEVRG